jgi:hypothetical protein
MFNIRLNSGKITYLGNVCEQKRENKEQNQKNKKRRNKHPGNACLSCLNKKREHTKPEQKKETNKIKQQTYMIKTKKKIHEQEGAIFQQNFLRLLLIPLS